MRDAHEAELEGALEALAALATQRARRGRERGRRGPSPDRHDVRALLVPLGELLRESGDEPAAPVARARAALERARAVCEALGEPWREAVAAELALACAEHVQAVDERYLDLPDYDFAYTFAARERLEARLVAARALGLGPPERLLEGVRRADRLLEPYRARGGREEPERSGDAGTDGSRPSKRNV